ncbi:hypothetical protein [Candidatus Mesenet endosymbiont of Agriotes lineatus]|uniref:hypothetical protein n=1 Tax=Candidatus Mesenet endosymbiont of Agriotes lineatus TaxID=3077948 RepID=UPI0030CB6ED0
MLNANAITSTKIAISTAFGAGVITIMLKGRDNSIDIQGWISEINMEWKESLMSGLITAVGTGIGTAVLIKLLRRFFCAPNTRVEQADQSIEEFLARS